MTGVQLDVRKAVSCSNDLSGRLKNLSDGLSNTYVYADQDSYEPLAQIHHYTNAGFEICQDINNFQFRLYNPIFTMEHHYEKCFESLGRCCFCRICFVCIRSRYAQAQAFGV